MKAYYYLFFLVSVLISQILSLNLKNILSSRRTSLENQQQGPDFFIQTSNKRLGNAISLDDYDEI